MPVTVTEINTPLYQRVGENLYLLNIQTIAKQVKMLSEESSPSDVQTEIELLRKKIAGLLSANDAMIFKGVVNSDDETASDAYEAGWTYKIGTAGEYKGQQCEIGDLLICIKDYADAASNDDWTVVQTNIDGALTGPVESTDGNLLAFDGITGKVAKDSGISASDVTDALGKSHEHTNKTDVLDKLTTQDGALLFDGKRINDGLVEVAFTDNIETIPAELREGGLLVVNAEAMQA